MPEISDFYLFGNAMRRTALHLRPVEPDIDDGAIVRAHMMPDEPVVFEHSSCSRPMDLAGTEFPGMDLLSSRAIDLMRDHGFAGWRTYEVQVTGKNKESVKGYHGLQVHGRCGPIDDSKSRPVWRDPVVEGGPRFQVRLGHYFDVDTWDGNDFFMPEEVGGRENLLIYVTDRVKRAFEKAKLTNVKFEQVTEVVNYHFPHRFETD